MSDLLARAIEAAGGETRWKRASTLTADVRTGGLLMRSKLKHRAFAEYTVTVSTGEVRSVLEPYPRPGRRGVFAGDRVWIESGQGEVLDRRHSAREAFLGLGGRLRHAAWWDHLDALYFAGYAFWNYLNAPFLLAGPGFESSEGEPYETGAETWRRLEVRFPEGLHTHCREQTFYFDERGLLRRHDYAPDVVAPFARAAHVSGEHRDFDGLTVPTKRRVTPIGARNRPLPGPVVVSIALDDLRVS
jgi:hypothetical protein